jgi:Kef-type K+ transport system membrane component KefB
MRGLADITQVLKQLLKLTIAARDGVLVTVALALGTAALSLSPALGAFPGGLLLTETEFDHRVIAEVVPTRNLFATLSPRLSV